MSVRLGEKGGGELHPLYDYDIFTRVGKEQGKKPRPERGGRRGKGLGEGGGGGVVVTHFPCEGVDVLRRTHRGRQRHSCTSSDRRQGRRRWRQFLHPTRRTLLRLVARLPWCCFDRWGGFVREHHSRLKYPVHQSEYTRYITAESQRKMHCREGYPKMHFAVRPTLGGPQGPRAGRPPRQNGLFFGALPAPVHHLFMSF